MGNLGPGLNTAPFYPPQIAELIMDMPTRQPVASPWKPLKVRVFLWLWIASIASNIGTWMHEVGSGWLMTSMSASPQAIALVQVAGALPVFLLALPAGALADIVNKRRYLLAVQCWMAAVAVALTLLTLTGQILAQNRRGRCAALRRLACSLRRAAGSPPISVVASSPAGAPVGCEKPVHRRSRSEQPRLRNGPQDRRLDQDRRGPLRSPSQASLLATKSPFTSIP
jgi:hypothetical protein